MRALGVLLVLVAAAVRADEVPTEVNLLSWGSGALLVKAPAEYSGSWSAWWLLDERPDRGWASPNGDVTPKAFVIELAERSELSVLEFDTAKVDGPKGLRAAKNVLVEVADEAGSEFSEVARLTLAKAKDKQRFSVKSPRASRYVRLTVLDNHGDPTNLELMDFRAFGKQLTHTALADNSGTFATKEFGKFHLRQRGIEVAGCYEHDQGLIQNGGFDGRVLRFTWSEDGGKKPNDRGPAIMIFPSDGQSFVGFWWYEGRTRQTPGTWTGTRVSKDVGLCPHWKADDGSASGLETQLANEGRARLYGINFDVDSDRLRDESKPALEALATLAKGHGDWGFTIEGHTDSTATAAHNQAL